MILTPGCVQLLTWAQGTTEELVRDVAGNPTDTWTVKRPTDQAPGIVEVALKEYEEGKRYLVTMAYDRGKEKEVDYFIPVPPVVPSGDAKSVLEDVCRRFGLTYDTPDRPTQLLVGHEVETREWMHIHGAMRPQDHKYAGLAVGHHVSKERYCVDLAFTLDLADLYAAFKHND